MMKRILLIILSIFIAQLSFGEVYKWVDEKGVVHFTDDINQIPEKYRRASQEVGIQEERTETKKEGEPQAKKKEDAYRDRLGRGEEYWKSRADDLRKKIQTLQEKLESLRLKYNELTEKFNSSKSSVERATIRNEREQLKTEMDQYKNQIAETKEILEKKLADEAELYKAKPEWVKP